MILVCPDCSYVQEHVPIVVGDRYFREQEDPTNTIERTSGFLTVRVQVDAKGIVRISQINMAPSGGAGVVWDRRRNSSNPIKYLDDRYKQRFPDLLNEVVEAAPCEMLNYLNTFGTAFRITPSEEA